MKEKKRKKRRKLGRKEHDSEAGQQKGPRPMSYGRRDLISME
jgi:hypothetical protein